MPIEVIQPYIILTVWPRDGHVDQEAWANIMREINKIGTSKEETVFRRIDAC